MKININRVLLLIIFLVSATSCIKQAPENVEMNMLAGRYISEKYDSETLELWDSMLFEHEFKGLDGRMVKDSGSFSSPLKVDDVWFLGMKGFYSKYSFDAGELEEPDNSFTFEIYKKNGGIMLCHIEDSDNSNCFIKE
ncbi:hypothetical protein [Rheinheimera faecalis]|uniref:hypothetical protein n=1 Tax=Rheinheimera faecalis TaxID=2901141 RepID=UPI001E28B6B8|nr:hypothetical protein [Rheinheimera faecalis]